MVDLRNAETGSILITKQGEILRLVEFLPPEDYFDVVVEYLSRDGVIGRPVGTRFFDGTTFSEENRQEDDPDVIKVYTPKQWMRIFQDTSLLRGVFDIELLNELLNYKKSNNNIWKKTN